MSHKKAGGSTQLGRDSVAKRLGVKIHDGQAVKSRMIIIRQRGSNFSLAKALKKGTDDTLFALIAGKVKFSQHKRPAL